jgi:hypothetical protein
MPFESFARFLAPGRNGRRDAMVRGDAGETVASMPCEKPCLMDLQQFATSLTFGPAPSGIICLVRGEFRPRGERLWEF